MTKGALTADTMLPEGEWARVDADVLDIGRRIAEGDELWRGDPSMSLVYSFLHQEFQVWGVDAHGDPYCAATNPTCDHTLLQKLAEYDWQRGKMAAMSVIVAEAGRRAEAERREADARGDLIDRMRWAVRRDFHGERRQVWGYTGGRKR